MFRGIYRGKQAHPDDLQLIMERAHKAGVQKMIITGTNLEDSREALELIDSATSPIELYSTVGCHPTRCNEFLDDASAYLGALEKLITSHPSKVVAIGECGLDYDRLHFCPKDIQKRFFAAQFDLAEKTKLPMFLHNRNTGNDFCDMIRQNRHRFTEGVVHSFDGTMEEMQQLVDLGLYIGINGCSLKTEENLKVAKAIPEDRLMFETDGPWCEIRPTHASHKHLDKIPKEEKDNYAPPSKKKERFEMGSAVKSRCEPCAVG
ncbi:hypothetical protein BCR43DRAFT_531207 [Syncephalastrum racemosum]|uniref:Uncharacterized protein n=1 Tax=Syncephalastrum racemosum TaxID=13706 RepID=A0A1X2HCV5_SYNRA|nr:hypothetical protein BCR43DRAFT_531207 [Syncephalastrum racemosum]